MTENEKTKEEAKEEAKERLASMVDWNSPEVEAACYSMFQHAVEEVKEELASATEHLIDLIGAKPAALAVQETLVGLLLESNGGPR